VAANGVGCDILHSADGGVTWAGTTAEPFALLLLDIAATNANVVALGALTLEYSLNNASTFNSSLAPFGAGQCIRSVGAPGSAPGGLNSFAAIGDWGLLSESNGPAISTDSGAAFSADNVTGLSADARYGSFPSAKVWYIAAGDWPGEGSDDSGTTTSPTTPGGGSRRPLFKRPGAAVDPSHYAPGVAPGSVLVKTYGSRLHLVRAADGGLRYAQVRRDAVRAANAHGAGAAPSTWEAQIAKTTDGGKTWSVVFTKVGAFYFNEIECTDENNCCVVAETGSGNGTEGAGTFFHCTNDGGATWVETLANNDPDSSLIAIDHFSPTEFWAAGCELGFIAPKYATFWHSVDAGKTWVLENKNETSQYAIDLSCDPGANCWAPMLDIFTQETSIARLNN
jgi:hypothetical protein